MVIGFDVARNILILHRACISAARTAVDEEQYIYVPGTYRISFFYCRSICISNFPYCIPTHKGEVGGGWGALAGGSREELLERRISSILGGRSKHGWGLHMSRYTITVEHRI